MQQFEQGGYFQRSFGYRCVDAGEVPGRLGTSFSHYLQSRAALIVPDPVYDNLGELTDAQVFTVIECIWETIALPVTGTYHAWSNCGMHYTGFDLARGQVEWQNAVNVLLRAFPPGFHLTARGKVELLLDAPADEHLHEPIPAGAPDEVRGRVQQAIALYRRGGSSWNDRLQAVRLLGDALEFVREDVRKRLIKKDEGDLFEVLNRFSIRHHKADQQADYDLAVFVPWLFRYYLSALQAALALQERS